MNDNYVIPLNELLQGYTDFNWEAGKPFFENFENSDILDADLDIAAKVEKSGRFIGVDCKIKGSVTLACDRCLEELNLPVRTEFRLSIKFGPEYADKLDFKEGDREIIYLPESDADLDMSQSIYDYVILALPMQKVHKEGECNEETLKYIGSEMIEKGIKEENNPFAALKGLLDKK